MDLARIKGYKRYLFLQGPVGPFFNRLGTYLKNDGAEVLQVCFNGGDLFYAFKNKVSFRGEISEFGSYLESLTKTYQPDCLVLFGDCRPYHRMALSLLKTSIPSFVFEEGYLRPNWITLEEGGVNSRSKLSGLESLDVLKPESTHDLTETCLKLAPNNQAYGVFHFFVYWIMLKLSSFHFKYYIPHRKIGANYLLIGSLRWMALKAYNKVIRSHVRTLDFCKGHAGKFLLIPMQVAGDSQIQFGSRFSSNIEFLDYALGQISLKDKAIPVLIKQHPLDIGYECYSNQVSFLINKHKLSNALFVQDGCLPTILRNCKAVITINSTVGFSALIHEKPVLCTGRSIYSNKFLLPEISLENFLENPPAVQKEKVIAFRSLLINNTQIPGAFYSRRALKAMFYKPIKIRS